MVMSGDIGVAHTAAPASRQGEAAIRVMAVDDDDYFREMLSNELTEHGFSVSCFPDGPSFLEALDSAQEWYVIVLDVHLLVRNVGRHVSYREIYDNLHYRGFIGGSGDDGYKTNVRSAIKRIRAKFRMHDETFDEIENYTAFGYVWGRGCGTSTAP